MSEELKLALYLSRYFNRLDTKLELNNFEISDCDD